MHGYVTFPGVQAVLSASMSLAEGITPSRCVLEIAPQPMPFASTGNLELFYDNAKIGFRDCVVDYGSSSFDAGGEIWRLQILDRRYKWAWGQISGSYNLRFSDGTLKKDTKKKPRELAELCLDEMGESGADVNELPNDVHPTVEWSATPPAEALAQLCDILGCRVVLGLDDRVRIVRVGIGNALPPGGVMSNGVDINPPELPGALAIACGPTRFQADFELEAVGMDTDGSIVPIGNLTYKPTGGWGYAEGGLLLDVSDTNMAYQLAETTVKKWYRIKEPIYVPGLDLTLPQRELVLPLLTNQCETMQQTASDGTKILVDRPAEVYGVFRPEDDGDTNTADQVLPMDRNTPSDQIVKRPFSIDAERGIVMFDRPIFKTTGDASSPTYSAADLRLRTSCHARYPGPEYARAVARFRVWRNVGDPKDPWRYVERPDIVARYIPIYSGADYKVSSLVDNTKDVKKECDYYLDRLLAEYQTPVGQTIQYAGLMPIQLDGAIQQVTWSIGPRGTITVASRNTEQRAQTLPYNRRREQERLRSISHGDFSYRLPILGRWNNVQGRFEGGVG